MTFFLRIIVGILLGVTTWASYYVTLNDNELNPGSGKTIINMYVTNESNATKAIELTPKSRLIDEQGTETMADTNDIIVFPRQLIIPARSEKAVAIRWLGEKTIPRELSYRVVAQELNVGKKQEDNTKMVRTQVKYVKSVYVAPYKVVKSVLLEDARRDILDDGTPVLMVKLYNNGSVHNIIQDIQLEYKTGRNKVAYLDIPLDTVEPFKMAKNILAGQRLEGWVPWPATLDPKTTRFLLAGYNTEQEEE